jgi:hypothetical protein
MKIRYTPKGTRYADGGTVTWAEEMAAYDAIAPKEGFVRYSPHPRGPRLTATNPAASSALSQEAAAQKASKADPPSGKA